MKCKQTPLLVDYFIIAQCSSDQLPLSPVGVVVDIVDVPSNGSLASEDIYTGGRAIDGEELAGDLGDRVKGQ